MEMSQLEPILKDGDSSRTENQMRGMNSVSCNPESQQLSILNKQMDMMLEAVPDKSEGLSMTYLQMGQIANANGILGSQTQMGQFGALTKNVGSPQFLESIKRKAPMEPLFSNPETHQLSMANKRVAHMEHRPWLKQAPTATQRAVQLEVVQNALGSPRMAEPNKKTVKMEEYMQTAPGSPRLAASSKKIARMESFSGRSGSQRSASQKNQTQQIQPSSKLQKESFESVRSKMRDTLAAALALVIQCQDKCVDSGKKSESEAGEVQGKTQQNPQSTAGPIELETEVPKESNLSTETCSIEKSNDGEGVGKGSFPDAPTSASTLTSISDLKEFQSSNILPYGHLSFSDNLYVKDELLQGNGLSWVLDSEMDIAEIKEVEYSENQTLDHEVVGGRTQEQTVQSPEEKAFQSPDELAFRIEAELFKLFGGVNKKYKEKGRSLMFNLKDRNNPELREKVMSGEITPERLCSMTAEELASKELSEWRMAKAEELAQMVVLPDSELDMRRLVKKTHKGEVEVEQYDSAVVEVPVDANSHSQSQTSNRETEVSAPLKVDKLKDEVSGRGGKSNSEDKTNACPFTIPSTEATDYMQGLMADDELKDLPPIVSLDEFMESLDMEPPFEILPGKVTPISDKDCSETGSESKSPVPSPKVTIEGSLQKHDDTNTTDPEPDADLKTSDSHAVIKPDHCDMIKTSDTTGSKSSGISDDVKSSGISGDVISRDISDDVKSSGNPGKSVSRRLGTPKGERLWEGSLDLSFSTFTPVIGIYKSGAKTSAREWPGCLEIKGTVKLDVFKGFLQELPQSRSRSVMVLHFVPKDGSSETECESLQKEGDCYIKEGKVGFAEPCPGVEIYFCSPRKIFDMLSKMIKKQQIEELNAIDNGLVGVIVWRKLTSPKPSSHKHISKKQQYSTTTSTPLTTTTTTTTPTPTPTPRRQHDTNTNTSSYKPKPPAQSRSLPSTTIRPAQDDDDDVPPGFGPGASREDDDLPEFNFSGGSNLPVPQYAAQRPSRGAVVAPSLYPKSHTPSRPVDQMRELIQKYGQNNSGAYQGGGGVAVQPWNDDDDDDIPEWQPSLPPQPQTQYKRPQAMAVNSYQQPMLRPSMGLVHQQQQTPLHSLQNVAPQMQNPNLAWQWTAPAQGGGGYGSNLSCQPEAGQFYGEPDRGTTDPQGGGWRQNAPKSRGF